MKKYIAFLIATIFICLQASSQTWLDKLGKKAENAVKNKVEQRVENKAANTTDKALDQVEGKDNNNNQKPNNNKGNNNSRPNNQGNAGNNEEPSLQSYSKYDFVTGEKVIFFNDFSNAEIGDFPAEWNTNGSGEVVTTNNFPGRWLKTDIASYQAVWTDKLLKLPENYTIEFDVVPTVGEGKGMAGWGFRIMQAINPKAWDGGAVPGKAGFAFGYEYYGRPYYRAYDNQLDGNFWDMNGHQEDKTFWEKENHKYHVAIWVQKTRIRVYHGEGKMFDLPRAIPDPSTKFDRIRFDVGSLMFTNFRIAVGMPDMRNKLLTEGKLVSYGIYFDVNKDVVKPESYGTLKEIAQVLSENPDVKIKIVGHTDSDGDDASNLDLSKRRGAAVKNELVKTFGIDAARITSDGMGEKQPVAANDTPANKALNRRVEFIKQ